MPRERVEPTEIPEVAAYEEAKAMLDAFIEANHGLFDTYRQLAETVNQRREAADKLVRARGVSCGPWDAYQTQTKYNAEALYEALGRDGFLRVGGSCETVTQYGLDKAKVEAAIARGEIPDAVVKEVKTVSPRYRAPKEITT